MEGEQAFFIIYYVRTSFHSLPLRPRYLRGGAPVTASKIDASRFEIDLQDEKDGILSILVLSVLKSCALQPGTVQELAGGSMNFTR